MLQYAYNLIAAQLINSTLETTRKFWRKKVLKETEDRRWLESSNMFSNEQVMADRARFAEMFGIEKFTCDACGARYSCSLAFDPYNTDDDCLMEK